MKLQHRIWSIPDSELKSIVIGEIKSSVLVAYSKYYDWYFLVIFLSFADLEFTKSVNKPKYVKFDKVLLEKDIEMLFS